MEVIKNERKNYIFNYWYSYRSNYNNTGFFVYNKLIKKTPDMPMNTEGQMGRPNMGNGEEPPARPDENNTEEQSTDSQNTDNNSNT